MSVEEQILQNQVVLLGNIKIVLVILMIEVMILTALSILFSLIIKSQWRTESTLVMAKEWFRMGRDQHSDAKRIMDSVQIQTEQICHNAESVSVKTDQVKIAVDNVPNKVIERLNEVR